VTVERNNPQRPTGANMPDFPAGNGLPGTTIPPRISKAATASKQPEYGVSDGPVSRSPRLVRRVEVVIDGQERLALCETVCRDEFLSDTDVPRERNGKHKIRNTATVTVAWSGRTHVVSWRRTKARRWICDGCGAEHEPLAGLIGVRYLGPIPAVAAELPAGVHA
jgi:hypothetical protein